MPLKNGYGYETLRENFAQLHNQQQTPEQAAAIAYAHARLCYFRRYPNGLLPSYLAYPKSNRARNHYDAQGKPRGMRASVYLRNPSPPRAEIAAASSLLESFSGKEAQRIIDVKFPKVPRVGLVFGELIEVGYRSRRDGQLYRHTFRLKKSRPLLAASSDGKSVYIVGGRYAFTDRGIEDR